MKIKIHKRFFILLLACAGIFTAFKCYAVTVNKGEFFSVRVMDGHGEAIPGLSVSISAPTEYTMEVSNEIYVFQFQVVGTYVITFAAAGYGTENLEVSVLDGEGGGATVVAPIYMQRVE